MPMIAIVPPQEIKEKLHLIDVPGKKETEDDFHITLFYFKKLSFEEILKVTKVLYDSCKKFSPAQVKLKTVTQFEKSEHSDNLYPIICKAESEELMDIRERLAKLLDRAKINYAKNFDYNPHLTLAYSKKSLDEDKKIDSIKWRFSELVLFGGGKEDNDILVTIPFSKKEATANENINKFAVYTELFYNFEKTSSVEFFEDPNTEDDYEKILLKHDIKPIKTFRKYIDDLGKERQDETSILGFGDSTKTFEAMYKGKLVVAKITKRKSDYENAIKLHNLKQELGEDGKYIATVYNYFQDEDWYITIIEKLVPLDSNVKNILWPSTDEKHKHTWLKVKEAVDKDKLVNKIKQKIESMSSYVNLDLCKSMIKKIPDVISFLNSSENFEQFRKNLNKLYGEYNERTDYWRDLSYFISEQVLNEFKSSDNSLGNANDNIYLNDFIRFLKRLREEFNIIYRDLHSGNIMMRPSTKEIVIADPGNFQI